MIIRLDGKKCVIPHLDTPTLRKIKQVAGVPAADMDNYTLIYAVTAVSAGVSYSAAADLWRRHRAKYGRRAADLLIGKLATWLGAELRRQIDEEQPRRALIDGIAWNTAFMEGR